MSTSPLFAIGDVHGCARELHILLAELPLTPDSTLVFLGDLIDRGNYSREVVSTVINLSKKYRVIALRGNHEDMFVQFLEKRETPDAASFIFNGGSSTLASYSDEDGSYVIPDDHRKFIFSMPLYYETEKFFFVHAGLPEVPLKDLKPELHRMQFLWARHPFLTSQFNWGKVVIHGHTPISAPDIRRNRINIDTGCVYDGSLTAMEVNSGKLFSVEKSQKNEPRIYLREKTSHRTATRFEGAVAVQVETHQGSFDFETLNYNEFGLLIWETRRSSASSLTPPQKVSGVIGNVDHRKLGFSGTVVRKEDRRDQTLYGVKLDRVYPVEDGQDL
jgi:serine/threonine protein phosphatase 1